MGVTNRVEISAADLNVSRETKTIFALSSGVGKAGVAVIRISGPSARFVLETLSGVMPPPGSQR